MSKEKVNEKTAEIIYCVSLNCGNFFIIRFSFSIIFSEATNALGLTKCWLKIIAGNVWREFNVVIKSKYHRFGADLSFRIF